MPATTISRIYLVKYDADGEHLWDRAYGNASLQGARDLAMDGAGNVLMTGYFESSLDFGSGPLESAGSADVFLAKMAP